jgi:hypothetical protein
MGNRKLLTFAAIAFMPLALLVMLIALTAGSRNTSEPKKAADYDKVIYVPPHLEPPTTYQTIAPSTAPAPVLKPVVFATQTNVQTVQDSDLKGLAAMVHLAAAKKDAPSAEQWTRALPIAKKLAAGACDCEQRNWLNQFITMGNYALSGSAQYHESAKLMDTLPLNDQDVRLRYYSN